MLIGLHMIVCSSELDDEPGGRVSQRQTSVLVRVSYRLAPLCMHGCLRTTFDRVDDLRSRNTNSTQRGRERIYGVN